MSNAFSGRMGAPRLRLYTLSAEERRRLTEASGRTLWWEMCTPITSILIYVRDQLDKTALHPKAQRHEGKRCLKAAIKAVDDYHKRLRCSGDYHIFSMFSCRGLNPEEQRFYKDDVKSEDLCDYWYTIGSEGYQDILPFYTCMENKIRLMISQGNGEYDADACGLVNCCYLCSAFNYMLRDAIGQLRHMVSNMPNLEQEFSYLSMRPLLHILDQLGRAIYGAAHIPLDESAENNIAHGVKDVLDRWWDFTPCIRNAMSITPEFQYLFRTKGFMMKQIDEYAQMITEIETLRREHKIKQLTKQNK